jgi:hypothetical protein
METKKTEDEERRLHLWLCDQSYTAVNRAKELMWKIEADRAKRYGRTDAIAGKADVAMQKTRETLGQINKVIDMLNDEKDRKKGS